MSAQVFSPTSLIGQRVIKTARLSAEIDRLTAELGEEKAHLLAYAKEKGHSGLKSGGFTFSRRTKATWLFSDAVKTLSSRLKALQEKEKENGKAAKVEGAEHLVLSVSIGAVVQPAPAPADVAALNDLLERTPSHPTVIRGGSFVPRTWEEGETAAAGVEA